MNAVDVAEVGAALESASAALSTAAQAHFACRADRLARDAFCADCASRGHCPTLEAYEQAADSYDKAYAAYHDAVKGSRSIA